MHEESFLVAVYRADYDRPLIDSRYITRMEPERHALADKVVNVHRSGSIRITRFRKNSITPTPGQYAVFFEPSWAGAQEYLKTTAPNTVSAIGSLPSSLPNPPPPNAPSRCKAFRWVAEPDPMNPRACPKDSLRSPARGSTRGYRSSWYEHRGGPIAPAPYECHAPTPGDASQMSA